MDDRTADQSGYADNEGLRLYWEVHGDGPTTVVLLGVPQASGTIENMRMLVPSLARDHRVLTYDVRGTGRSSAPTDLASYTMETAVSDAIAVLEATETAQAVFVGVSRSCRTAVHLGADHAERVLGVFLLAPAVVLPSVPVSSDLDPDFAQWVVDSTNERPNWFDAPADAQLAWRISDTDPTLQRVYSEPYNLRTREHAHELIPRVEIAAGHAGFVAHLLLPQDDDEQRVRSLECPVVVVNCTEDLIVQLPIGDAIAEWTGGTLITLEGSGHVPGARDPIKVVSLIRDFLNRTCSIPMPSQRWTRGQARPKRALFVTCPVGLGHTRRDMAVARELRELHPDLEIEWFTEHPVTEALAAAGETVHQAAHKLMSIADRFDHCCDDHEIHVYGVFRDLDAVQVANASLLLDVLENDHFDLVVADEAVDIDFHLHENPELKRFAYAWLSDWIGWQPLPDDSDHERAISAEQNEQMIEQLARYRRIRDRSIYVGDHADIPPGTFGPGLPEVRQWANDWYEAPGYITGFDPSALADPAETRKQLGWGSDERVVVVSVGGSGTGGALLERAAAAHDVWRGEFDRTLVVCGPRIDPAQYPDKPGLDVVGYVPDLPAVFAAADVGVLQGGLTASMELVALRKPFVYIPLERHFEQQLLVPWRLDRYNAGYRLDWHRTADPHEFAGVVIAEAKTDTTGYREVRTDGAARAALSLAELI